MNLTQLLESEKERAVTQMSGVTGKCCENCNRKIRLTHSNRYECADTSCACHTDFTRELRAVLDSYGRGLLAGVREEVADWFTAAPKYRTKARLLALLDEAMKV